MKFKEWILKQEMLSPVVPPAGSADRNPYINGKWSTSAFVTGKAKVKKNAVRDSEEERRGNLRQDGFHL